MNDTPMTSIEIMEEISMLNNAAINYYFQEDCGLSGTLTTHLGKRSAGWPFLFHAFHPVESMTDLVGFLENTPGRIVDEYGQESDVVVWLSMAATWGSAWATDLSDGQYVDGQGFWWDRGEFC